MFCYFSEKAMYAVIATGGKQFRVTEGQNLRVELLSAEVGAEVSFPMLMRGEGESIQVGKPYLEAVAKATVVAHGRAKKIKVLKFRRRKHHMKQMGHRQYYTEVKITTLG